MENLIIESDNLIAMRKLLPEYEGKIDVMPIDPPYNTNISYVGYKDFDSRWNVFMRERLEVAHKLSIKIVSKNCLKMEFAAHTNLFCCVVKI